VRTGVSDRNAPILEGLTVTNDTTPEAIAQWMLDELERKKELYQADAAREIARKFGSEFTYTNANGNPAIDKRILKAFRKLSGDTVVWERWAFCWRRRRETDAPSRKQA
jgi:hypothetical protein